MPASLPPSGVYGSPKSKAYFNPLRAVLALCTASNSASKAPWMSPRQEPIS
eukprot:CAMPEP_0204608872 /NCGR_PEP_ID=MMETSP0661-20131031/60582_1 /ASSEMBLY_ACC=CAM_ASM_000606 /TAXON_ID=109239 /ORGANISM="Alexandrium margalefi, Strain AMGDE01CS-322" /LENGTH=50 /DNA_ID=CAMNT_0051620465 /DNA_START=101 /DNA_END=250 /DNA_ORIENTATION=-